MRFRGLRPSIVSILCALCLVADAFVLPAAASAATSAQLGAQAAAKQAQAAKVRAAMDGMRSDLAARMAEYQRLNEQLGRTRQDVGTLDSKLADLRQTLGSQQAGLNDLAVRMYERDRLDGLTVLFDMRSVNDFVTALDFLTRLGQQDAGVIDDVKAARDEQTSVRDSLKRREADIMALQQDVADRRAAIVAELDQQQKALDSLSAAVALLVRQQEAAAAAEAQARAAAAALAASNPGGGGAIGNVDVGGGGWLGSHSLLLPSAIATVDGHPGEQFVSAAGQPTHYAPSGLSFDWGCSTYGNADNSPPNSTASASSRPFHENELTCAHKTLPFGTLLAVSYEGKHVIVVVTDRGPYITGRSLDLSTAAARAIGLPGVATVHVEIVVPAP